MKLNIKPICFGVGWPRNKSLQTELNVTETMSDFDTEKFLNEPIYALDFKFMVGDVEDFLEFSESNVEWQLRRELLSIQQRAEREEFEPGYKEHLEANAEHRFKVSLPLRIRYGALVALITFVEWSVSFVVGRLKEPLPVNQRA